jgi:uncharacterized protein YjbI with pentapeptide repeats
MADQQHFAILQQGFVIWYKWRKEHIEIYPDLSGSNLSGSDLRATDFSNTDLSGSDLSNAILRAADLNKANLSGSDLSNAILNGADLSNANLSNAILNGADLSNAILNSADLSRANLSRAKLNRAKLNKANLSNTILNGADLSNANLSNANLSNANLSGADLNEANLSGASLDEANLNGTNLDGAKLKKATMEWTILGSIDLQTVQGLETIQHLGPSTIGIDTLERSGGNIPETFLRGAGVSDTFITYARSLVANPIEYYTCFISYSSQDQKFAERLHTDLQSKGIRCWFAPEDLRIGEKFRQRIDESIHLYDKLLLLLSEHSVSSSWVETEVESAMEKEHLQKKLVLFPIKLDETAMETSQAWAADIRRTRHIGDFRNWKQHDDYQRAFTRLLRDLQPEKS